MDDCYDTIDKASNNYSNDSNTKVYSSLVSALNFDDKAMVIALLKFFNLMIARAEDEIKQAKFIAKLEAQNLFVLLKKWGKM